MSEEKSRWRGRWLPANAGASATVEPSPASDGSVSEPVAWGVLRVGGRFGYASVDREEAVEVQARLERMENWKYETVPLYRSPTLTVEERVALKMAATVADVGCEEATRWVGMPRWTNGGVDDDSWQRAADMNAARAAALRGLLERLGGGDE